MDRELERTVGHHLLYFVGNSQEKSGVASFGEQLLKHAPQRCTIIFLNQPSVQRSGATRIYIPTLISHRPELILTVILKHLRVSFAEARLLPNNSQVAFEVCRLLCGYFRSRFPPLQAKIVAVVHSNVQSSLELVSSHIDIIDAAVGVSQQITNALRPAHFDVRPPIISLPYGLDRGRLDLTDRRSYRGPLRLVYIGRLVRDQKRFDRVLDLIELLSLQELDVRLDIFGEGEFLPAAARVRSHLKSVKSSVAITIHGAVDRPKLLTQLNKFHILIQTSDFEGTPLAIMEAMSRGVVPVLRDYGPELQKLIPPQMAGLIVNSDDMSEMAKKIVELSKSPSRLKFYSDLSKKSSFNKGSTHQWLRKFDSIYMPPSEKEYSTNTLFARYQRHIKNFVCQHQFSSATVLWGGGEIGRLLIDEAKKSELKAVIIGVIDQTLHKFFYDYREVRYYSEEGFGQLNCDEVIVTSRYFASQIIEYLNDVNLTRCRPFRVRNLFADF